jgi:putative DNA primase/helicase
MSIGYVPLEVAEAQEAKARHNFAKPRACLNGQAVQGDRIATIIAATPYVKLINGTSVTPEPISWIWPGWLAKGKFHLLAGKPSAGKTTVALDFCAAISRGGTFPDGQRAQPGNVVIWSGEDGLRDTLVPRLMAAKADMSRVHLVGQRTDGSESRAFDPAADMRLLVEAAERLGGVELLTLDPVVSSIQGDSHKNAEVRRGLQPVVDFCEKVGCAAIGITHLSKGTQGQDPIDRITGSLAFGAVARVALLATREEDSGDEPGSGRRVITRVKSNIGPDGGGFFYEIRPTLQVPGITTSKVEWLGVAEGSARDIIGCAEETHDPEKQSALGEAVTFLRETLAEKALSAAEVISAAKKVGISERTLNRAKRRASVKAFKQTGQAGKGHWMWWLPDPSRTNNSAAADQGCQDCQPGELGDVGKLADEPGQEGQGCQPQNLGNLGNLALSESENGGVDDGEPIVEGEL